MTEEQLLPGERRMKESVEQLIDHLEGIEEAYHIREHNGTVDFTVGDPELWPQYSNDEHIRVISGSSVDFNALLDQEKGYASQTNPQMGKNVHLPPAREELWDELEAEADFSEKFTMVDGTFELGGLLPSPNGICTPHVLIVEEASVDDIIEAVDEIFRLYDEVYNGGEEAIKEKP